LISSEKVRPNARRAMILFQDSSTPRSMLLSFIALWPIHFAWSNASKLRSEAARSWAIGPFFRGFRVGSGLPPSQLQRGLIPAVDENSLRRASGQGNRTQRWTVPEGLSACGRRKDCWQKIFPQPFEVCVL
jgi:hypothetical protein